MDTFHARKLALCAALLLGACSDGDDSFTVFTPAPAPAPTPTGPSAEPDEFGLPVVKSHLSEDEAGNADGSLIVVLRQDGDSGHAGDSGGIGHDDVPFVVNAESDFRFCVEANGDPEHRLEVLGAGDEPLLQVDGGGCGVLRLAEGNYIKRVFHGDSSDGLVFVSLGGTLNSTTPSATSTSRRFSKQQTLRTADSSDDVNLRRLLPQQDSPITTFNVNSRGCPGCYLDGITLSGLSLKGFNFERAHFGNANISNVDFSDANLRQANFNAATLENVKLNGADLRGAELNQAIFCPGASEDCRVEVLAAKTGEFTAPRTPLIGAGDATHASTYEYQGTRRGWAYLLLIGQDADGNLYNKRWDHKDNRGWSRQWRQLPSLPNGTRATSQPTAYSAGTVGTISVSVLGRDTSGEQVIYNNWRTITSGWSSWGSHGRPAGQRLISAPTATGTRYATDTPTYYLAVLAQDASDDAAAPVIWFKRSIYLNRKWRDAPEQDPNGGPPIFSDAFPEWNADSCIEPETPNAGQTKPWCPLPAPQGQRFASAPVLARVGFKEAKLTVLMESGELWEYGLDRVPSRLAGWRKLDTPGGFPRPVVVDSAPAASNPGFSQTDPGLVLSFIGTKTTEISNIEGTKIVEEQRIYLGRRSRFDEQYTWTSRSMRNYETGGMLAMSDYGFENTVYTIVTGSETDGGEDGNLFGFNLNSGDTWEDLGFPGSATDAVTGFDVSGAHLAGLVTDTDFTRISTEGLELQNADLTRANLKGAVLQDVKILNSRLTGLDLSGTDLSSVDLGNSDLRGVDLTGSSFAWDRNSDDQPCTSTQYFGAEYVTCLAGVDFSGADLTDAKFDGQDLRQSSFDQEPILERLIERPPLTTPIDCSFNAVEDPPAIKRTSLRSALASANQFPPALWRSLDLTNARIVDVGASTASDLVDYSHALMPGVRFEPAAAGTMLNFSNSQFFGASLDGADFSGDTPDGTEPGGSSFENACLRNVSMNAENANVSMRQTNLRKSVFRNAQILNADASGALFDGSDLAQAQLSGSDLSQASLGDSDMRLVNAASVGESNDGDFLAPTKFFGSNLNGTILVGAKLRGARFNGQGNIAAASLRGALLANADLRDADFTGAILDEAALYTDPALSESALLLGNANFTAASFQSAYLEGVNFSSGGQPATLTAADFSQAFLANANLKDTSLQAGSDSSLGRRTASLSEARLEGADLSNADLEEADLSGAQLCIQGVTPDDPDNPGTPISDCSLLRINYSYQSLSDDGSERVLRQETVSPTGETLIEGADFKDATCPSRARAFNGSCNNQLIAPSEPRTCAEPDPSSWNPQPC